MAITSVRPKKAKSHVDELTHASLFAGADGDVVQPHELRISTTYDAGVASTTQAWSTLVSGATVRAPGER